MLDFTSLQAGAEYKRDQFVHEAAHARLLRTLGPTTARVAAVRPTGRRRFGSWLVARTVLFLALSAAGLALSVASTPVSSAPATAAPDPTEIQLSPRMDHNPARLGCWVAGDLVWAPAGSAGNPAVVAETLCAAR
jgi:hypothetical protein